MRTGRSSRSVSEAIMRVTGEGPDLSDEHQTQRLRIRPVLMLIGRPIVTLRSIGELGTIPDRACASYLVCSPEPPVTMKAYGCLTADRGRPRGVKCGRVMWYEGTCCERGR